MKEEFLHFIWKYSLYHKDRLVTSSGDAVEVIHPGFYNRDSGPDFFNALIRYGGTLWAGNVEIHTKASNFCLHGHNHDHAYDNVILHVVAVNDRKVFNAAGRELPAAVISFDETIYEKYINLVNNPHAIACHDEAGNIDRFLMRQWISALVVERLESRYATIRKMLYDTGNDWEEVFYRMISRYFGFRVNAEPFEMLASTIPFRIIRKHLGNRLQVEALLFGTAGLLTEGLFREAINDRYFIELSREYRVLASKYSLKPVHGWLWKFSRLRPVNFPTIRISQLAAMLAVTGGLFSRVTETRDIKTLRGVFDVEASEYWNTHYVFGKESSFSRKCTGESAADILIINSVTPILFTYGKVKDNNDYCIRAIDFLEATTPEENRIIKDWEEAGVKACSALDTQGLLHLRNEYCRKRRCLDCRIGGKLISKGIAMKDEEELTLEPHVMLKANYGKQSE